MDIAANIGRDLQPQPREDIRAAHAKDLERVKHVVKLVAALMHLWPKVPQEEIKAARAFSRAAESAKSWRPDETHYHQWIELPKCFQCAVCGTMARSKRPPTKYQHCLGAGDFRLRDIIADPKGHSLAAGSAGGILFLTCVVCGAAGSAKPKMLRRECTRHRSAQCERHLRVLVERGQYVSRQYREVDGLQTLDGKSISVWKF